MKLPMPEFIRRLELTAVRAKDLTLEVEFDGLFYLHASSMHGHRLELIDTVYRDQQRATIARLQEEKRRLTAELARYKEAHG